MDVIPIIAIASSARDLEPVVELLRALPDGADQAFVVVQKVDPGRGHMPLNEALAQRVSRPVIVARDGVAPERGHIYVLRADLQLTIIKGLISLIPSTSVSLQPGDGLLTSVA